MTRQSDAQIGLFASGNAYNFIPRRVSIAKNVQTVVETVASLAKTRAELKQVILVSILLLEYSSLLMQESNRLAERRGLNPLSHNAAANEDQSYLNV